jgi:hypothetical protein
VSRSTRLVPVLLLAGLLTACTSAAPAAAPAPSVASSSGAVADDGPAATDAPRPGTTDVVLARAGFDAETRTVRAAGYVSPVVESGGTCTLELRGDGRTVTVTGPGEPDATTTVCGGLAVPADEIAPGEWQAVLRYRSGSTAGESEPIDVRVPA